MFLLELERGVFSYYKRECNCSLLIFRESVVTILPLSEIISLVLPVVFSPYLLRGFHVKILCVNSYFLNSYFSCVDITLLLWYPTVVSEPIGC